MNAPRGESRFMLDAHWIAYLATESGGALLAEATACRGDTLARLTALRHTHSPEASAAAVELLDLRKRAASRFTRAESMFFTPAGLEQATSEAVAAWRAARYPADATVLDLCCGVGSDAVALATRGTVLAVDRDFAACRCAVENARALGVADRLHVACTDVTRLRLRADAAFLDPSRRSGGRRFVRAGMYSPPLEFAREVHEAVPNLCVKVSPGLPDEDMESLGARLEFVSERGECKEAALWMGEIGPGATRTATLLPAGVSLTAADAPPPPLTEPQAWLYEPDPAVIRAHLVGEIAQRLDAGQLDPRIAYLTADCLVATPFATAYRIIEWLPFSLNRLRDRMRKLSLRAAVVKKRAVLYEPDEICRRLPREGDRDAVVVLGRLSGAPVAMICEPPPARDHARDASGRSEP